MKKRKRASRTERAVLVRDYVSDWLATHGVSIRSWSSDARPNTPGSPVVAWPSSEAAARRDDPLNRTGYMEAFLLDQSTPLYGDRSHCFLNIYHRLSGTRLASLKWRRPGHPEGPGECEILHFAAGQWDQELLGLLGAPHDAEDGTA